MDRPELEESALRRIRRQLGGLREVPEPVARGQLARITAVARTSAHSAPNDDVVQGRVSMLHRRKIRVLALVFASLFVLGVLSTGLAYAGVRPARAVLSAIGIQIGDDDEQGADEVDAPGADDVDEQGQNEVDEPAATNEDPQDDNEDVDEPEADEVEQPEADEVEQPEADEVEQPEANDQEEPEADEVDQPESNEHE